MSKRNFDAQDELDEAVCACTHYAFEHVASSRVCTRDGCDCKRFTTFKNDGVDLGHGPGAVCATKEDPVK